MRALSIVYPFMRYSFDRKLVRKCFSSITMAKANMLFHHKSSMCLLNDDVEFIFVSLRMNMSEKHNMFLGHHRCMDESMLKYVMWFDYC